MSAAAQAKGVKGVIIDGRCRDIAEHRALQFPVRIVRSHGCQLNALSPQVFARGHSTLGQGGFVRPSELNISVTIVPHPPTIDSYNNAFPSVVVNPRDYVVADEDGVVVVRPSDVDAVLEKCSKNRAVDDKCMADLKNGRTVMETFQEHRGK